MKLLFLDLDGTLLNDKKEINKADMDAIDEMISKGHKVIINTGRPLYSALLLSEKFGFLREGFYISSFNGGLIVDPMTKKRLKYDTVPDEIVRHMFDEAYKLGLHAHTYNDEYVVSERDTKELEFYTKRISMPPFVVSDFRDALSEGAPKIIIVSLDGKERLIEYREKLRDYENEHNLYSTFSDSRLLEYANPLANKGEAVRFLCRYLGVDISDSIAAGDEENDMPMIEAAGIGVCMKNGQDTLKSVADYVTERTNNECGIKEIIEKFILNSLCQHI
ncbi:MAG: Cof-type HAD-IIB family hydrolase [Lachnospiraceae bacterium]|nr:Cof-type HAD-IIB family hydrolase [Lachnospiraceae bacterium]